MSGVVPESLYVALVEFALFVLGGAGLLQLHAEKSCVRYDEVECVESGPTYYAVAYGVVLLASAAGLGLMTVSVANAVLVPERQRGTAEGMALAALHWQLALAGMLASTLLVAWGRASNERRALFAVLVRTGVGAEENEYLTKLYILCALVLAGFLVAFCVVLYVGLSRLPEAPARSANLHSLCVTTLVLSAYVQHWLSAYRARVCENVGARECMPALSRMRASWFVEDHSAAYEAGLVLAVVALCDVLGVKARGAFEASRQHKARWIVVFALSRGAVGAVLGCVVLLLLSYDVEAFRVWNVVLWGLGVLCSLCDLLRFGYQAEAAKAEAAPAAQTTSLPFDMPMARKLILRRRKAEIDKKLR